MRINSPSSHRHRRPCNSPPASRNLPPTLRDRGSVECKQRATSCKMILKFTHKDTWNDVSPLDRDVFSDSVLCMGNQAMGETSWQFCAKKDGMNLSSATRRSREELMGNECTSSSTFPGATSIQLVSVFKQG